MTKVPAQFTAFAAGEVAPDFHSHPELGGPQTALSLLENLAVRVEGGLTRCPGTRFVLPLFDEAQEGELLPVRFSDADSYMLVFNGGKLRFMRNGGFIVSGGNPYQIDIPYAEADLPNLRWRKVGANIYLVCTGYQPRVLQRVAHDNWTLSLYEPLNGPVDAQNLDTTVRVQASAVTGTVSLTGVNTAWDASDVGSVMRLDEPDLTFVPLWKPNEEITRPVTVLGSGTNIGDTTNPGNAFDGSVASVATKAAATELWIGRTYSPASKVAHVKFAGGAGGYVPSGNPLITVQLWTKTGAAPGSATDGTLRGELSFVDTADETALREIASTESETAFDHIWLRVIQSGAGADMQIATIQFDKWQEPVSQAKRRFQGRVYEALSSGNAGPNAPTHDEGDVSSGDGNITWRYIHSGYGFVRITNVSGPTSATAVVLSRLPESVVTNATYRWWPGAWSPREGWPDQIQAIDQALLFGREDVWWRTRPADPTSFEVDDSDETALAFRIVPPDGSLAKIEWFAASDALLIGTRDREWIVRAAALYDPLRITTTKHIPKTKEGSASHIPADVDDGLVVIAPDRRRLHFIRFDTLPETIEARDLTYTVQHIMRARATHVTWQRAPGRILWVRCQDGSLKGVAFVPKQRVLGWFRRPFNNGIVERAASLPSTDEGNSDVYLIVRRTIDFQTRRYVEIMQDFFEPVDTAAPTAEGAWFVDCGLRYTGAPVKTISGLGHLEGQEVAIHADGAMHPRRTVQDGAIKLQRETSDAIIGIPQMWRARSLPIDLATQAGGTKGRRRRANHVLVDVVESAGGRARSIGIDNRTGEESSGPREDLVTTGGDVYGPPVRLRTGSIPVTAEAGSGDRTIIDLEGDDTMPFTMTGLAADLDVTE